MKKRLKKLRSLDAGVPFPTERQMKREYIRTRKMNPRPPRTKYGWVA